MAFGIDSEQAMYCSLMLLPLQKGSSNIMDFGSTAKQKTVLEKELHCIQGHPNKKNF